MFCQEHLKLYTVGYRVKYENRTFCNYIITLCVHCQENLYTFRTFFSIILMMEIFAERLEKSLKLKKISQKDLAEFVCIRRPTISDWKKNGSIPAGDICFRIADFLGVDCRWLVTGESPLEDTLSPVQKKLLDDWEELNEHEKAAVLAMIGSFLESKAAKVQADNIG